ncbi:MAG TPA: hypothetical protein VJ944_05220, partial [Thermoplasmataceae archaeon]|nr:hypothetical protein [Thermoplasmataceae archaeon]
FFVRRRVEISEDRSFVNKRYQILGMKDLYLGYAGGFPNGHNVHEALQRCKTGDHLKIELSDKHIYLIENTGIRIGRLSKAAQAIWRSKINSILEIKVLAMVEWGEKDTTEKSFADLCKCERWEVPICEFVSERII